MMDLNFTNSVLFIVITVLSFGYYFCKKRMNYFVDKNILHLPLSFPFGNLKGVGTKVHTSYIVEKVYNAFVGKDEIAGIMFFLKPSYLILSPELIKNIFVRDFANFHDRGIYYNEKDDPITAHLFNLEGNRWKSLRAKLTPTFTSGKMKMMFETVLKCSEELENYLEPIAERSEIIEIKDVLARFTTDIIANVAFGLDVNSIKNPDEPFRKMGKKAFELSPLFHLKVFFGLCFNKLAKLLRIIVIHPEVSQYFSNVVKETLDYRKTNNIQRKDFLQLLIEMYSESEVGEENKLNLKEVIAQCFVFFLAGFETSSTTMSFCLYELAKDQDIQNKIREEISSVLEDNDGIVTYENLLKMEYLGATIDETLRLYPALDFLIRRAAEDYPVPNTKHVIPKGSTVMLPAFALQRDPQYFPNPEKFDPDRFNAENKDSFHPFSYLPFGRGPHDCIGKRFGIMQTRIGLVHILRKYRVTVCDQTPKHAEFKPAAVVLTMNGGIVVRLEKV